MTTRVVDGAELAEKVSATLPNREVLTLTETADALGISPSTAKKLAARGELPGLLPKVGNQWRISKRLLVEYMVTPV